jgi:hypothetical protein
MPPWYPYLKRLTRAQQKHGGTGEAKLNSPNGELLKSMGNFASNDKVLSLRYKVEIYVE